MSKNFIFGIGLLTAVGAFFLTFSYDLYWAPSVLGQTTGQLLVGSLVLAFGVGILVVAFPVLPPPR